MAHDEPIIPIILIPKSFVILDFVKIEQHLREIPSVASDSFISLRSIEVVATDPIHGREVELDFVIIESDRQLLHSV